jgi:hypothetical protein
MINELEGLTGSSFNGKPTMRTGDKSPERSGWELLAWAVLEQAVDDLATFARYGLITPEGDCLPWPFAMQRRMKRAKKGGWQYYNYDELRAEAAMLREQARILAEERDEARVQYRSTEALAMALVKTIDELKTEKAELVVKLVNLKAGSRPEREGTEN